MHNPIRFDIGLELKILVLCMACCVLEVDIGVSSNDLAYFQPQIRDGDQYHAPKGKVEWGYDDDYLEFKVYWVLSFSLEIECSTQVC